jgi:hypothetical protein
MTSYLINGSRRCALLGALAAMFAVNAAALPIHDLPTAARGTAGLDSLSPGLGTLKAPVTNPTWLELAAPAQAPAFNAAAVAADRWSIGAMAADLSGPAALAALAAPVPEPSTWALLAAGLLAVVLKGRRRARRPH